MNEAKKAAITRYTPIDELPTFLSVEEFSAFTGVQRNTVYKMIAEKALKTIKLGREFRINKEILYPEKGVSIFELQDFKGRGRR
jgi:excisionase family DNA binding protein